MNMNLENIIKKMEELTTNYPDYQVPLRVRYDWDEKKILDIECSRILHWDPTLVLTNNRTPFSDPSKFLAFLKSCLNQDCWCTSRHWYKKLDELTMYTKLWVGDCDHSEPIQIVWVKEERKYLILEAKNVETYKQ